MANAIVTLKIMPESPETDLKELETKATEKIKHFGGEVGKVEIQPVAFGLNSLNLIFVMDESIGSTESLEGEIAGIEGVVSVDVSDVRRAIG
ncbi:MAG: elongation factor 1-beta [Nanoarchaeota archaeon]|nr:elongation factor 1-beta [Nanoarchaeota archaeon]